MKHNDREIAHERPSASAETADQASLLNDRPLTYQEAAAILKTSPKQVKRLPLKRVRLGYRTVRIMYSELIRFLRSREG